VCEFGHLSFCSRSEWLVWRAASQHLEVAVNGSNGPFMSIDTKGGLQTFAASARALGQSGESGRSMRGQIHKFCKRSNGDKPTLTDAALSTNGCFGDAAGAILHDCKSHVSLSDHERVNLKA
jgi:hypothetical protein